MYEPLITNDATVFGILISCLALLFYTASLDSFKKFYTIIPMLLLAYFLPAILSSIGLISPHWYDPAGAIEFLRAMGIEGNQENYAMKIRELLDSKTISKSDVDGFTKHSDLYFVASRYLLPASLVLLILSTDLKAILGLGPKALIMFFTATLGIVIGGPLALWAVSMMEPDLLKANGEDSIWRGLSTVAGSWIGGGANQTAMKEINECGDTLFGAMIIVDVFVANLWMAVLLFGAGISDKLDKSLKADNSAIATLTEKVKKYQSEVSRIPTFRDIAILMGIAFALVGLAHFFADHLSISMSEFLTGKWTNKATGKVDPDSKWLYAASLKSHFFWLIVFATLFGLLASLTKARKLEGAGASKFGSLFIYILVVTIGMKMNLVELYQNWGQYKWVILIGLIWMLVHVVTLLTVAKIIRAPFFFVAVGSQANVGGAASAPIVASAFSPALAPVGVLLAVLGYALGTFAALACAFMMSRMSEPEILSVLIP